MHYRSAHSVLLALALSALGGLTACSNGGGESHPGPPASGAAPPPTSAPVGKAPAQAGAESPEAAFEQLKTAANGRDYRSFFNLLVNESQNQMLTGMMIGAGITLAPIGTKPNPDKQKELQDIFKKYGVKDDGAAVAPGSPAEMMEAFGKKLEGVQDRAGLFNDLMLFLEKNSLSEKRATVVSLEGLTKQGDDKATGVAVLKYPDGKTEKRPVELRKIGGRWLVFLTKWT